MRSAVTERRLALRAGEMIEVRSEEEILATLDAEGRFDAMPFMPEMLAFCGKRVTVYRRADKTCHNNRGWSLRRLRDTVHLDNVRCDGQAHAGCQAGCMIFWKEAWLKRVITESHVARPDDRQLGSRVVRLEPNAGSCTRADLASAARRKEPGVDEELYVCQATELTSFSTPLRVWDLRQYVRDIWSGNLHRGLATMKSEQVLETLVAACESARAFLVLLFNTLQRQRGCGGYPALGGRLTKTPAATLNLQPGDIVKIKTKTEILATVDTENRNRGMFFDSEQSTYCGGLFQVLKRVERIVDEKTGRMIVLRNGCIVLDGVFCKAEFHGSCPRAVHHYWREIWLTKLAETDRPRQLEATSVAAGQHSCELVASGANR